MEMVDTLVLRTTSPGRVMLPGRRVGTWTVLALLQHKMIKKDEERQIP